MYAIAVAIASVQCTPYEIAMGKVYYVWIFIWNTNITDVTK